jgi:hypothetical protein
MKPFAKCSVAILAFVLVAGISSAFAQTAFKIPFDFQAAGKKLPKGDYTVALRGDGQVVLHQEATGKEVPVPVLKKLEQPKPPVGEPRLVFDEVGDFAPSYTEYLTVFILSEVWLPGHEGLEVHVTKGAHKSKMIKGQKSD